MPFDLNTFVEDKVNNVESEITKLKNLQVDDLIDKVTPSQVKDIVKADIKSFLDERLGDLTGVKISQIYTNIGERFQDTVTQTIDNLRDDIEAQIVGCIDHAIQDILDKAEVLERIFEFENIINFELSRLRNRLESIIDEQLRKLEYDKLKIHQTVLYRQKIRRVIQDVCPWATPASPSQVAKYKEMINGINEKNRDEGIIEKSEDEIIPEDEINNSVVSDNADTQQSTETKDISNKTRKDLKENPDKRAELQDEVVTKSMKAIKEQTEKQVKGQNNQTWCDCLKDPENLVNCENKFTTDFEKELAKNLKFYEGVRSRVYKDSRGIPTVGVGYNMTNPTAKSDFAIINANYDSVLSGDEELTKDQIDCLLYITMGRAIKDAKKFISIFDSLPYKARLVVADMSFNLGLNRLSQFKNFKSELIKNNWSRAADEMVDSAWYRQVGRRSVALVREMRSIDA